MPDRALIVGLAFGSLLLGLFLAAACFPHLSRWRISSCFCLPALCLLKIYCLDSDFILILLLLLFRKIIC